MSSDHLLHCDVCKKLWHPDNGDECPRCFAKKWRTEEVEALCEMASRTACPAHNQPKLSYIAAFGDAERRLKARQCQYLCKLCARWIWGEHYTDQSAMGINCWQHNKIARMRARHAQTSEGEAAKPTEPRSTVK